MIWNVIKHNKLLATMVAIISMSAGVLAQSSWPVTKQSRLQQTEITSAISSNLNTQLHQQEVARAHQLRQRYSGLIAKDLSDIELLGIAARNDFERVRYARLFAEEYSTLLDAAFDFDRAVTTAVRELHQDTEFFKSRP